MKILLHIFLLVFSLACTSGKVKNKSKDDPSETKINSISNLNWLKGSWIFTDGKNSFHEKWKSESDSSFIGYGFVLSGNDTVEIENLSLHLINNQLIYSVSTSKDKKVISSKFVLASSGSGIYSFENLQYDFPKRIRYKNISETEMEVIIDAGADSSQVNQKFSFKKLSD